MSENFPYGPQGQGLDPEQFLPIQSPQQESRAQEDKAQDGSKVSKRQSDKIMAEAKDRFRFCAEFESVTRPRNIDDWRFLHGDSDNMYQWPTEIANQRRDTKPCITINKTQQHVAQITNDQKQNRTSIKYRPTGGGATYQSSQVLQGVARHVMAQSNFESILDLTCETQVGMGIGYWRLVTDYVSSDSFDQEIYIRPVPDPLSVYLDPSIQQSDGSDARFGFIFTDVLRSVFEAEYPEYKEVIGSQNPGLALDNDWITKDMIRQVEYFRLSEESDELIQYLGEDGQPQTIRASNAPSELIRQLKQQETTRYRKIMVNKCEWFKIVGGRVVKRRDWPGSYIPIIRVPGIETKINGIYDRRGHVRMLKDPQRVYNYYTSAGVEAVALQSKTPYIGPAAAIEGYETVWAEANDKNHAILPYNQYDDNGNKLDRPERQQPPVMPSAIVEGLQISSMEMMMVSGQYHSQMGQDGNEVSGKAISERQRQGDNATYHYVAKLSEAVRFTGVQLLDLFPKIYDTERVIRILGEDGTESSVMIDPMMQGQAARSMLPQNIPDAEMNKLRQQGRVEYALNPGVGRYEVAADVGPAYSTQRQEAWNALSQIIQQNEGLTALIGDLALKAADFPMADEAAERLRRMVPAQALGDSPPPEVLQLQQQVQNLTASLAAAIQALGDKAADVKRDQEKVQIDVFRAETDRIKALAEAMDPQAMAAMVAKTVMEALQTNLADVKRSTEAFLAPPELPPNIPEELGQEPQPGITGPLSDQTGASLADEAVQGPQGGPSVIPQPAGSANDVVNGMRQAPDGNWYIPDPQRPGQYMQVTRG